jgi:predicted negative regulator of RcsB-dependent stress response
VSKDPLQIALAVAIIVIPVIGLALIVRELWFGWRTRQMGQVLAAENALPTYDGDLTPSGRPTKADADRNFERYAQEAEDNSEDWRAWFRLAVAYDDARDRKRARAAMRQASNLYVRSLHS